MSEKKALPKKIRPRSRTWIFLAAVLGLLAFLAIVPPYARRFFDQTPPVIDVWYGLLQTFGQSGLAQRWVNVLGNVADPQSGIASLSYRLNGGPVTGLRIGPDDRRLARPGDFDVEIEPAALRSGKNSLTIAATNANHLTTTVAVTVLYQPNAISLPYTIDWSTVRNLQDVLQVVDGKWHLDRNGIRPLELGYDRMLAIGDTSWTNYVVTVPVTVHGFDPAAFHARQSGNHAGISVDLRWLGHSDDPVRCPPPHCGWNPVGDFNKYYFKEDEKDYLALKVKENEVGYPTIPIQFEIGHTYIFKQSVETTPQGNEYRMKVWEPAVSSEPANWMFQRLAAPGNPANGAFSLVAHYSDVTFGNISVTPLQP